MTRRSMSSILIIMGIEAGCSEQHPVSVKSGEPCAVEHAGALAEDGCSFCLCTRQGWSCSPSYGCACTGDQFVLAGGQFHPCPCEHGRLRCHAPEFPRCPPPREDTSCAADASWAQDPSDGFCCEYASPCAAPETWPLYASQQECDPYGCGCRLGVPYAESDLPPIECGCLSGDCPTLEEALDKPCDGNVDVAERRGCGKVELSMSNLTSWALLFDEASGAIVGRMIGSDVPFGACGGLAFGEQLDCPDASVCARCSSSPRFPLWPLCEPRKSYGVSAKQ